MRPNLFAFYRAGGMILGARIFATFRTIERALARAPVVARCCVVLHKSLARVQQKQSARTLSLQERKRVARGESVARDEVWIAEPTACPSPRGLSSVCVYFLTHIGDRHDASCTPSSRRREESVGVCVIVPTALSLCDNRRSITAWRGLVFAGPRDHNTTRPAVRLFILND